MPAEMMMKVAPNAATQVTVVWRRMMVCRLKKGGEGGADDEVEEEE